MKLNDLKPAPGSKKVRRRVGRGIGSGRGKTSGRGQKGQAARSGFSQRAGWEGGRSSLIARLPKRGFNRARSEERRVGKEGRDRRALHDEKKKEKRTGAGCRQDQSQMARREK